MTPLEEHRKAAEDLHGHALFDERLDDGVLCCRANVAFRQALAHLEQAKLAFELADIEQASALGQR